MIETLAEIRRIAEDREAMPDLIGRARAEGATWPQIADAARMSRAGVIKLHTTRGKK